VSAVLVDVRPGSASPRPWRFPSFERRTLPTGLRVVLCDLPGSPMAAARLVLEAGAATEPFEAAGIGLLAARSLPEGTQSLGPHELAEVMEGMGADIKGEVSFDSMQVRLEVPASRLPPALELMADIVRRPGFRPAEVDRLVQERLDQLAQEKSVPDALAARAFEQAVFAPGSAYARSIGGDVETISSLTPAKIEEHYLTRLAAAPATLVLAGDLSGLDVEGALAGFGSWPESAESVPEPDVRTHEGIGRRIVLVDRPGSVQSALAMGHAGPPRRIDDYVATGTMAMCLGGVFGSRLNMKLREEKGYTYGAHAGFEFRRHGGAFSCRTAVQTEVTADAVADAVAEIERTAASGIPESELASVREYRVGIFPIAYERPAAVAMGLAEMVVHGLPEDWFDSVRAEMAVVTSQDVSAAAARRLSPDRMAIVVVGDGERIRDSLAALELGPVVEG